MKRALLIVVAVLGLGNKMAFAKESVLIRPATNPTVVGPRMNLGEIAEIIGTNKRLLSRLRTVDLGQAAPAGHIVKITPAYIRMILKREGFKADEFQFSDATQVEVLTQSQEFSTSKLLPKAKEFISDELKVPVENVEVGLSGVDKKFSLPAGIVKINFRPSLSGQYEGYVLLTSELEVNGHFARLLPLRVKVEVLHPAVATIKRMTVGEIFSEQNVRLVRRPTSKIPQGFISGLGDVLGKKAARVIPPGAVVKSADLYDPPIIKRGQRISVIARRGNIEISVDARAVEDGKVGESIRVENISTHKVLRGKVMNEKAVLVGEEAP